MSNPESQTTENLTAEDRHDIDEDNDQANAAHKIIPAIHGPPVVPEENKPDIQLSKESSKTNINQSKDSNFDVQNLIQNDLKKYVNTPVPKDYSDFVQCHVKRVREGFTKGFESIFTMHFDGQNENNQTFLLSARKHITIGGHAEYFIGIDSENPSKTLNDDNSLAALKGINITGSEYIIYDHQNSSTDQRNKQQSGAIIYYEHILGSSEPRKLTVLLHDTGKNIRPIKAGETIIDEWRSGRSTDLIQMQNKAPTYDEKSKTYTLKLHDSRIKLPSHKNFQLIFPNDNHDENAVMQFGRIDDNNFALDYRHPLTAIQAFAIALSSFHNRFHS
ncbi:unnamed protein product [Rotaria sordida]|uniref:Tubby C-terminal domain-containing protein n=1 Tax=Rotaria sordida TaxID=392033 RepID=A0A814VXE5_9BILA|nr:unnamed protein product [Rotaria sordida]CAF1193969.1 unnamed protein product [Rotaria sordida]